MFKPKPLNSCNNTLNDSGMPGVGKFSPLTIASYAFALPTTSSDFIVRISYYPNTYYIVLSILKFKFIYYYY